MLHVSMAQGGDLLNDQAYLDKCSTVTAFKNDKFLSRLRAVAAGIKINCNAGAAVTNMKGKFGRLNMWYLPNGIANILSMQELEKMYRITYASWEGFYVMHTPRGKVCFYKDKHGLLYINLDESGLEAMRMLMQVSKETEKEELCEVETGLSCVQMVCGNYEGFTRREILQTKETCRAQVMLGSPSKKDLQGLVSGNMIASFPFSLSDVTNLCKPKKCSLRD